MTIYQGYVETEAQIQERYNRHRAKAAYNRIVMAVGKENADKMISRDMLTMTWAEIRAALETLADLAEKQVAEADAAEERERAELYQMGMGR